MSQLMEKMQESKAMKKRNYNLKDLSDLFGKSGKA